MKRYILASLGCLILAGCAATWGQRGSASFLVNTTQSYDERNSIRSTSQQVDLAALKTVARTGSSLAATIILQSPFAAITGAVPDAVDTTGEIVKSQMGGQPTYVNPSSTTNGTPIQLQTYGVREAIPPPKKNKK